MGPDNAAVIKTKLKELRAIIRTGRPGASAAPGAAGAPKR
jgi:hypothetical protein